MSRCLALATAFLYICSAEAALTLRVRENAGVSRNREVVRSGVPLSRSLNVTSVDRLAVVDGSGQAVPAEFQILARWNAGLNVTTAPIQWLLISFPASVAANTTATYQLVTDGSIANPAAPAPLRVTRNGDQITIDTGAAVFIVGGNPKSLFDEIRIGSTALDGAGAMTARINNADTNWNTTRRVAIESSGPLSAVVIIDGAYDLPAVGGGGIGSHRRYLFTAGSPTAIVLQTVSWEGALCDPRGGDIMCGSSVNAVRVARVRDTLTSRLSGSRQVTIVGAHDGPAVTGTVSSSVAIRQRLRADRHAQPLFEIAGPSGSTNGLKADGALLALSGTEGTLAVAIDHMQRYEPQALRVLDDGSVAIDIADDQAWLGKRQGLFATVGVAAMSQSASRANLDSALWAPLNHPLHAWPDAGWWAGSDAVNELPSGSLPS